MIVAGVMSGTSADGVDVALARITAAKLAPLSARSGANSTPRLKVLGHRSYPYSKAVRIAVIALMNAESISVAEISRLNWQLGEIYAECVTRACQDLGMKPVLVGMHGQTIYHQAVAAKYLGAPLRATWQLGEAAVVAERLRVPVVSDFRPADLAAGGQGAPLVPMLDYCLFQSKTTNRVLLNLGGIANVTVLPADARIGDVLAFDTGPANMVVDGLMGHCFGRAYDRGGKVAARGKVVPGVLADLMADSYFSRAAPKSCGREQFGAGYVAALLRLCAEERNAVATATELTVASIRDSYARFCWPHLGQRAPLARRTELIVAGGGVRNETMMAGLRREFGALGVKVRTVDELGLASQAKEAVAFALLAWLTFHGLPGNVPSATGAGRAVVLGKVSCG